MSEFSSEAKKAGLQEPEKPVPEMTEEKEFFWKQQEQKEQ